MLPKVAEYIQRLIPYEPGKPIEELERELGISGSIKLASNENPVGPSPAVVEAIMQNAPGISRYPDGDCFYLKAALAQHLEVSRDELILGNGSNELIELALRSFLLPGDDTVSAKGAFLVYDLSTRAMGGRAIQAPMRDYTHDLDALLAAVTPRTRIIFISNPNNPTGTMVTADEMERFMERVPRGVLVALDEAYAEYVSRKDYPDALDLHRRYDNLLVMRTFSKAYGLAGLRIGYGIASREAVGVMNKVRQPFNVNLLAQVAALAALRDQAHLRKVVKLCRTERGRLERKLTSMGFECIPSQANFILVKVARDGRELFNQLLSRGVIVRAMGGYGFPDTVRVTVGLPEENDRFLAELASVTGRKAPARRCSR
jgi:histidinol-phosphate aminotransferase